jgi:hypothetical protein
MWSHARHRHVRLVAILLEEHPMQHPRALPAVVGQKAGSLGEVNEDRARLEEESAVIELDDGDTAVRILRQEIRRPTLAGENVDFDELERDSELPEQQSDLVALSRGQEVVEPSESRSILT